MSVFVSIVATLAFESPILVIEKLIFHPKKESEPKTVNEQTRIPDNDQDIKPQNGQISTQF